MTFQENASLLYSMTEGAPVNIMCADLDGNIQYLNPKSFETLRSLQGILPVDVDKIQGHSYDVFHKNPAYQTDILKDASKLPLQTNIQLGEETLRSLGHRDDGRRRQLHGPDGHLGGYHRQAESRRRCRAPKLDDVEGAPVNIMCADREGNIQYLNPASVKYAARDRRDPPDQSQGRHWKQHGCLPQEP